MKSVRLCELLIGHSLSCLVTYHSLCFALSSRQSLTESKRNNGRREVERFIIIIAITAVWGHRDVPQRMTHIQGSVAGVPWCLQRFEPLSR